MRSKLVIFSAASLLAAVLAVPVASAEPSCASPDHPGGDWPSYGHDVSHTRHQPEEHEITPARAATLSATWTWTAEPGQGSFSGTPVVAGGCLYVGGQTGWVHAINADTGELVWSNHVEENPEVPFSSGGAGINSSLAVVGDLVYASVANYEHPYVAALDADTGEIVWTQTVENQAGAGIHSSPLVVDGLVVVGWDTAGVEFDAEARKTAYGGFAIIDATSGELLKRTYTIPPQDRPEGYSGGNIWSSFAADPSTKHAYVGTAAPYSPGHEHPLTNAIIKVDIDRSSPTFGEIVDSYKGVPDHYFETAEQLPCVPLVPGSNFAEGTGRCGKLDLDFAATPNIFQDGEGRTIVGELQKAGVYHFVDASTMDGIHDVFLGNIAAGFAPTNMSSTAFDGSRVFTPGGSANTMYALDRDSADIHWVSETVDAPIHVNPIATANGVAYTLNGVGPMIAYDTRTGFPLPSVDAPSGFGAGVSVARNTVYASGGDEVAALRPDPARQAEADAWATFLATIPTPPTTQHVDRPRV